MNARATNLAPSEQPISQQNPARNRVEQGEPFPPTSSAPPSDVKLAANRLNAQLSTGAVTEIGKQIVSQNATKHGLTGKFRVAPDESQENFDQLLAAFMHDEAPADQEEVQYVQYMAEATWLSRRAVRLQDQAVVAILSGTPEEQKQAKKDLALYLRYMTTHDRAYFRYATELRKRRNERARIERGFVSQKLKDAAEKRREANEIRKQELHELRKQTQILRQERIHINNGLAEAKAAAASQTLASRTELASRGRCVAAA